MLIKKSSGIKPSEITPESVYRQRREFLRLSAAGTVALASGSWSIPTLAAPQTPPLRHFDALTRSAYSTTESRNSFEEITRYNNFYEFGTSKSDPAEYAHLLKTSPWQLTISGEVDKPVTLELDDLLKPYSLEERIYRLRCVEAWSMVIPWVGFPLNALLKRFKPTSRAKYVEFTTLYDINQMPGQRGRALKWPYVEALRMDEAMHPLTILAVGLYGKELPNQNGAPLRLVVPWKYGFKSIKSIVRIHLTEQMPQTTWHMESPREYGFYANVNPQVSHPRWSQKKERRIGELARRNTLPFNGYAHEVAHLYRDMDLRKLF